MKIPFSRVASSEALGSAEKTPLIKPSSSPASGEAPPLEAEEPCRYLGQMTAGYLVFEDSEGLVLMDPHAAHERIRYEALEREGDVGHAQPLALPLTLPPSLGHRMAPWATQLQELGFAVEEGAAGWVLGALPVHPRLGPLPPLDLLRRAVDILEQGVRSPRETVWRAWASLACRGALKLGEGVNVAEARALWKNLRQCAHPDTCPHGRPVLLRLDTEQLTRYFGR